VTAVDTTAIGPKLWAAGIEAFEGSRGELHHRAYWFGIACRFNEAPLIGHALEQKWVEPSRPAGMSQDTFDAIVDAGYAAGEAWADTILDSADARSLDRQQAKPQPTASRAEVAAAEDAAWRAAESLVPLLGRSADITSDADDDTDVAVMLYPDEIAKLLRLASTAVAR
jgi:hypothetical protein